MTNADRLVQGTASHDELHRRMNVAQARVARGIGVVAAMDAFNAASRDHARLHRSGHGGHAAWDRRRIGGPR